MITNENTLGFAADSKIFDEFIQGKRSTYTVTIDDSTCNDLLENIEGNLILNTEELPSEFRGCYYYNNGRFPYILKKSLEYILLDCEGRRIVGKIIRTKFTPVRRFRFGVLPGEPIIDDPNGDSCIWAVTFKLAPAR